MHCLVLLVAVNRCKGVFLASARDRTVHEQDLRDGGERHSERDGRLGEAVRRLLSVRLRRLDQVASDTGQRVALEHVRSAAQTERSRHQERAR